MNRLRLTGTFPATARSALATCSSIPRSVRRARARRPVRVIVTAQREDQSIHGDLRVIGVPSNRAVARVLHLTGIDTFLRIHATVADALNAIDQITQN
jgi:hypothetical protein